MALGLADAMLDTRTRHEQRAVVKEKQPLATFRKHRGHKIWELDMVNREITEVPFNDLTADGFGNVKKTITVKPYFLYCSALNLKNATKQFVKIIEEKKKEDAGSQ